MAQYLKYVGVFAVFYFVLSLTGIALVSGLTRVTGVNAGTLANILVFFAALAAALRTGDGIFPLWLDASHVRVAADIRTHGVALATGFAAIALSSDLAWNYAMSAILARSP